MMDAGAGVKHAQPNSGGTESDAALSALIDFFSGLAFCLQWQCPGTGPVLGLPKG
jgi:hypothetical protein